MLFRSVQDATSSSGVSVGVAARGVSRMWKEGNHMSVPAEAVLATFGPATELWPDSRRGSDSDGWLPIQCSSEGMGRVEISLPLWLVG